MIYLTGATGHIGNNLARKLDLCNLDFKILARTIHRSIEKYQDKVIIGDIFSEEFLSMNLQKGDTLIHLAAYINLKNDKKDLTDRINFTGVKMIADFCLKHDIYLVYTSSTDAITSDDYLVKEPKNINLENLEGYYQKSKALSTNYILDLIEENKLKAFILYPSAVIGINDYKPSAIGKEIKRTFKRRIFFYFHGGYNFIDVEDVVLAIVNGITKEKQGSYIISGEYVSLYNMYKLIINQLNRKVLMIKIPLYLIKFVQKIFPKYKIMISALLSEHNYENQKMIQELDVKPKAISHTIRNTVQWFKDDNKNE